MVDSYTRPDSPIYIKDKDEKIPQFRTDLDKIHRIRCLADYHARVVEVISPSEIWLQLPNHIADRLTEPLNETQLLIKPDDLKIKMYVLAPLTSDTLARARIIDLLNEDGRECVKVRFIDHGGVYKIDADKFYELSQALRTHPWQTIPVMLFNAMPLSNECWSVDEVSAIKSVLQMYDMFWITPQLTEKMIVDDSQFARVDMAGLTQNDIDIIENSNRTTFTLGFSVLEIYHSIIRPTIATHLFDAYDQLYYTYSEEQYIEYEP